MKLLDLFAGIGGFSLGLESTGYFKTIAFVEKDEFCQKVLRKNFKNIPIESEVRDVKGEKYAEILSHLVFPASRSRSQEKEKEQMTTVSSGTKLLELLEKQNRGGLLEKMLKELLTSKKAWYSDRCKMIWKKKVSKSNVLLFQLQASVHGIKGNEFGLLHTPTATEIGMRSQAAMEKRKKYRESIGRKTTPPGNLLEQLHMMMYPTPNATNINTPQAERVEQVKSGGFVLRKKNKPHMTYGARLQDVIHHLNEKPGGKLNPEFVEFLQGYPRGWTKIEKTE